VVEQVEQVTHPTTVVEVVEVDKYLLYRKRSPLPLYEFKLVRVEKRPPTKV
jgi:hypothetical protein